MKQAALPRPSAPAGNSKPIGVFDSGIGGLSTLTELRAQLPSENFIYIADLAWSPYGNKTLALLQERAKVLAVFLNRRQVKAIVVACNTATAAAVTSLRQNYCLPIIGVEPGLKPAVSKTLSGVVGILATEITLASDRFNLLLQQFNQQTRILLQACPGLADAIEKGEAGCAERARLLAQFLPPLLEQGVDTLVLGCTHYPLILAEIRACLPPDVEIIDTSAAIARQVVRQLESNNILNHNTAPGEAIFYSNGLGPAQTPAQLNETFSWILGEPVSVYRLPE